MKRPGILLLLAAGFVLAWIGWRAESPTYEASETPPQPTPVPVALSGDVPPGFAVRRLEVDGICCDGCSGKLYAAVTELDEVREAAVDSTLGRVDVLVPAETSVTRLEEALTFGKYSAHRLGSAP